MEKVKMKMSLDLSRLGPQVEVYARIRENMSRVLHINLRNGPFAMIPDGDEIVILRARTPDERHLFLPCEVCGDHVECTLSANLLAREGAVHCEIAIYSNEYQLLYSPEFRLSVLGAAAYDDDVVEASDDFSALTSAINAANELANMRFSVEALPAGSEAAVEEREGDEVRHLHFSLPRGETGERGEKGEKGDRGEKGESGHGICVKGTYATLAALEEAVGSAAQGDMYNVGTQAPYALYMWDMTSAPAGWICLGQLQGETGEKGDTGEKGETGAAGESGNMHRNLLDNWYFAGAQISNGMQTGGFPINQRGKASYNNPTDGSYCIDRWVSHFENRVVQITSNGLNAPNVTTESYVDIYQRIPEEIKAAITGKRVTLTILLSNGHILSGSFVYGIGEFNLPVSEKGAGIFCVSDAGYAFIIRFYDPSVIVVAAKLELGDKQTLAREENGVWVLNDPPPDYGQELAKCRRYLFPLQCHLGYPAKAASDDDVFFTVECPLRYDTINAILINPNNAEFAIFANGTVTFSSDLHVNVSTKTGVRLELKSLNGTVMEWHNYTVEKQSLPDVFLSKEL